MSKKMLLLFLAVLLTAGSALGAGTDTTQAKARKPYLVDKGSPNIQEQNVVKILRTTNKAQINHYVPRVYEFKNANPALALRFMRRFVSLEAGLIDTYVGLDGKSGSVLVVIPTYQVPEVDRLMKELDRPGLSSTSASKYVFVQLANRSSVADKDNNGVPDVIDAVGHCVSNDTTAVADLETNAVVVYGPESGVDCAVDFASKYDIPTAQVNVSAKVYEIDVTNDGTLGLDYVSWKNGPGRALFTLGAFGEAEKIGHAEGINGGQQFDSGAGTLGLPHRRMNSKGANASYFLDIPSAFLDFLSVKGTAKVLTDTKVSAMSGQPAVFRSVEQIPFLRVIPAPKATGAAILPPAPGQALITPGNINDRRVEGDTTPRNNTKTRIDDRPNLSNNQFQESGVVLWVTPTISLENIDLNILTTVADSTGFDDTGEPLINTRTIDTDLRAKSGEEIVLGGVTRRQTIKQASKIPFLGSIPVLGYLFGGEITAKKCTTVVEVVTPTVIEDFSGLSESDQDAIAKAEEKKSAPMPRDQYGYDQYLLDPAK